MKNLFYNKLFLCSLWMLFFYSSCDNKAKEIVSVLIAVFTYKADAEIALKVNFINESEKAVSYAWDFGDNVGTDTAKNPSYTYSSEGIYGVTLKVKNSADVSDRLKNEVTDTQILLCSHYKIADNIQLKDIHKISNHPSISGMISIKNQLSNYFTLGIHKKRRFLSYLASIYQESKYLIKKY